VKCRSAKEDVLILHLVTDRQRLCRSADRDEQLACLRQQLQHAIDAGVDVIQIRERDLAGRELAAVVRDTLALARGSQTRIVVNDRLDVALACGADGVHLRGDSVSAGAVRAVVPPGFLVGRSVRSVEDAVRASGDADYLIAGTVWPTPSKPGLSECLGEDGLRAIADAVRVPVLAIGGVDASRLALVASAGAAGAAAIGIFASDDSSLKCRAMPLSRIVERARVLFESSR